MKRLAIGILAHVDSGKTTLSEGLLYAAGEIRKIGRVDHGDAFLDTHEIERDRGITIFSKQAILRFNESEFTLLDTPGHVDFSTEMERTLNAIDYAILVVSGSDGVQSHTETLWKLLKRYGVPVFLFVNKMDLAGAERDSLLGELKDRLDKKCVDFSSGADTGEFMENVAVCDDSMTEEFLDTGKVGDEAIRKAISERKLFPCYFGSALKNDGVKEFLEGIDRYTAPTVFYEEFAAKVFKISEDEQGNRLTHLKVTGGVLSVKETLGGSGADSEEWEEKVNQIRVYSGAKYKTIEQAPAGTVCAVTGLTKTFPGEGLGVESDCESPALEPVLTYSVELPDGCDAHTALINLKKLESEDPQLHVMWNEQLQEIHLQLMGEVQLEVLKRIILERFGMDVKFGRGNIAYKETIANTVEGVGHYEPLRHYAEVHLIIKPGKRGSGIHFSTACSEDELSRNWQRLILTHLEEKTHVGVLTGSPLTDVKIILASGRAHQKHTEGGDFRQATYRAVRQGLRSAESVLLEPWYEFRLEVPSETVGKAMTDIQQMCDSFSAPEQNGETTVIRGTAPVATMRDYHSEVIGYTRGKGRLSCTLKGYDKCHNPDEVIEEIGYSADNDLDNPADSVFCSHGAGFAVKWDKVPEYMHLESVLKEELDEPIARSVTRQRISEYIDRVAEDKELIKIFERTYGPIQRRTESAMYTPRTHTKNTSKPYKPKPAPQGPEYLLVDGYNIIFAWDELKALAEESLEAAREELIEILCNYQGVRQCEVILVFDAYKVKNNPGEVEKVNNINVVYTKEAETADMYIEKVTHKLSKKHRVRVATSDGLEQLIILGNGAFRLSADGFKKEVEQVESAVRDFLKTRNETESIQKIGDMIDAPEIFGD